MEKIKMGQGFSKDFTFLSILTLILLMIRVCEVAELPLMVIFAPFIMETLLQKYGYRFLQEIRLTEAMILIAIVLKFCGALLASWTSLIPLFIICEFTSLLAGHPIIEKIEQEESVSGN